MKLKIEDLIKMVYKIYRARQIKHNHSCPDEETLVCFCEGRLSKEESKDIQEHLLRCEQCAQAISLYNLRPQTKLPVPEFLIQKVKELVKEKALPSLLEITISIKDKFLEIVNTTGDIILGNEIIPLPVLRSRQIKEFREELTVVKDFQDIRININIEKKNAGQVKIVVMFHDKDTSVPLSDLRVSLTQDDIELESYAIESGKAVFDKVSFGKYRLQILRADKELGVVKLEIV